MKPVITILEALDDPNLFRPWFKPRLFRGDSWQLWRAFLAAVFGLSLDAAMLAAFKKHTGRSAAPSNAIDEAWAIVGRGGGKSLIAAAIMTYIAAFVDHPTLVPGETASCMCLATDKAQAAIVFKYVRAYFDKIPLLKKLEVSRTAETLALKGGIVIETHANDFGSVRGRAFLCAVCDEIAFWNVDESSASPDTEVLNAIRPRLTPNAKLVCISSPYAERGSLYRAHREHFGKDDSTTLVWMASSLEMNPTLSEKKIAAAIAADPERMQAEFGLSFRGDLDNFLTREVVESCVDHGVERRPPDALEYLCGVDPSGGRSDSFTLAVAHHENGKAVLDLLQEVQAPFSPAAAVRELCSVLPAYKISAVHGDEYGAGLVTDLFNAAGFEYRAIDRSRTELYQDLGVAIRSKQVALLDHPKLINQLVGLRLRTGISGRDQIDHVGGAHDDLGSAVSIALSLARGGDQLGVLDYFSSGQAQKDLDAPEPSPWSWQSLKQGYLESLRRAQSEQAAKYAKPSTPVICSDTTGCDGKHPADLVSRMGDGSLRCGACGDQFWQPGTKPLVTYAGFSADGYPGFIRR